ncbi:hypothetical protein OPKNFCMD_1545 [Methylobacterium crusticola]|uniref:Uncharacterized protein n=1 Tax=Methylobacterium crusticola TaxID=1697972 RepID=A0ABQ4QV41_9HYPH|nr:hypothetical protein [Methylobacterium crusticola]GJD48819.1 hypothetical protein OPKNFCMD_1545 [Methylobacterium crusticola]
MLGYREHETPTPPAPMPDRVHREVDSASESERLATLLAGLVAMRPADDVICAAMAKRNLIATRSRLVS